MYLKKLYVSGFRNLREQTIEFSSKATLIAGANGQGKTSLLEAIYLLSHSKSFRTASLENLLRWKNGKSQGEEGPQACQVSADVLTANGLVSIAFEIKSRSRSVFINGKQAKRASSFFGQLTSVVFTPEELQLVRGQPAIRRQAIDRVLAMVDPLYVDTLVQYQRALKQRNSVLSRSASDRALLGADLQIWDTLLAKHGRTIAEKRDQFLKDISPAVEEYYQRISQLPDKEALGLKYTSEFFEDGKLLDEDQIRGEYLSSHQKDFRYQSTTFGIHRDDVVFKFDVGHGPKLARVSASQGQLRSIALSYKFACIDYLLRNTGEPPIVLLDDVESELDKTRRKALYELLERVQSQVFVTSTEIPDLPGDLLSNTQKLTIHHGLLSDL